MEKFKRTSFKALLALFSLGIIITFYSCDKKAKFSNQVEIEIQNPNDFEVRLEIEGVDGCDPNKNPNYYESSEDVRPIAGLLTCVAPTKDRLWRFINLGGGTVSYTVNYGDRNVKIKAYKFDRDSFDKDNNPGEEVGSVSFKGKFGKEYKWTVGYGNEVKEVVPPPPSSGSGGNNSGNNNNGNNNNSDKGVTVTFYGDATEARYCAETYVTVQGYGTKINTRYFLDNGNANVVCGNADCANFTLPPGTYTWTATCGQYKWGPKKFTVGTECMTIRIK